MTRGVFHGEVGDDGPYAQPGFQKVVQPVEEVGEQVDARAHAQTKKHEEQVAQEQVAGEGVDSHVRLQRLKSRWRSQSNMRKDCSRAAMRSPRSPKIRKAALGSQRPAAGDRVPASPVVRPRENRV